MKKQVLLLLLLSYSSLALSQESCERYQKEGVLEFTLGNYAEALKLFQQAAKTPNAAKCPNLKNWIAGTEAILKDRAADTTNVTRQFLEPEMVRIGGWHFSNGRLF